MKLYIYIQIFECSGCFTKSLCSFTTWPLRKKCSRIPPELRSPLLSTAGAALRLRATRTPSFHAQKTKGCEHEARVNSDAS